MFNVLDWVIVGIYCFGIIALATYVSRNKAGGQRSAEDYFLAGRSLPWWAIGASLIAANISAEQIIGMSGQGFVVGIASGVFVRPAIGLHSPVRVRHVILIVVGVHMNSNEKLLLIVQAVGAMGLALGVGERRQQQRREDGDDRDDHQQFDQGEAPTTPLGQGQ